MKLRQLISNTKDIFPNTYELADGLASDVRIVGSVYHEKAKSILLKSEVPGKDGAYENIIRLKPVDDPTKPLSANLMDAYVKCTCPAFRFYTQYALYAHGALEGTPTKWAKVPAPVRNPQTLPSLCKHLLAVCVFLYNIRRLNY